MDKIFIEKNKKHSKYYSDFFANAKNFIRLNEINACIFRDIMIEDSPIAEKH